MTFSSALPCAALATGSEPPELAEVREVYQHARERIDAKKTSVVVVAQAGKSWVRIASLDQVPHDDTVIADSARVHLVDGKVLMVESWIQTPSGDWQDRSEHYFRDDGTLAFVLEQHLTSQVNSESAPRPLIIETRRYFDRSGKVLRTTQQTVASDGKTFPMGTANQQVNAPRLLRVKDLPFAKLLGG